LSADRAKPCIGSNRESSRITVLEPIFVGCRFDNFNNLTSIHNNSDYGFDAKISAVRKHKNSDYAALSNGVFV